MCQCSRLYQISFDQVGVADDEMLKIWETWSAKVVFLFDLHFPALHFAGVETQFCHNIMQPSYSPFGDMVPQSNGGQLQQGGEKKKSILELIEKQKRQQSIQLLKQGRGNFSPNQFDPPHFRISERRQKKSPTRFAKVAKDLPDSKVEA